MTPWPSPCRTALALAVSGLLASTLVTTVTSATAAASPKIVIRASLSGFASSNTASAAKGLLAATAQYEKAHPSVKVQWLPGPEGGTPSIVESNAQVETLAAGGDAPDIVWEQYGPIISGSLPAGLLQNMTPFLEKPNPYVPGNKKWLSLYSPSVVPYMKAPNGHIKVILGSAVEDGFIYNKADFKKAGITTVPATWAAFIADLSKLKAAGLTPFIFADGSFDNPSWFERMVATSLLANQVNKFNVSHSIGVTSSLDVAVGIHKGIISMSNPSYAEGWKLLGQLARYSMTGESTYNANSPVTATTPPLSVVPLFTQGKVAVIWDGNFTIPSLDQLGFANKFGVFPEPTITKATTPLALGTPTQGAIGGPNGVGQWSITSEKADHTMTPEKTKVVMNFLAWLFAPKNVDLWLKPTNTDDIPTEPSVPKPNVPGLESLVPKGKVPITVDVWLDDVLGAAASTSALRLVQDYVDGSSSYAAFSSQWQSLLTTSAESWAAQNHVNLNKY